MPAGTSANVVIAVAVRPVLGQDLQAPRDIPAAGLNNLRKRFAPVKNLDEWLRRCSVLRRTGAEIDKYPLGVCPFSCAPDDRACEVIIKMHGPVGDAIGRRRHSRRRIRRWIVAERWDSHRGEVVNVEARQPDE